MNTVDTESVRRIDLAEIKQWQTVLGELAKSVFVASMAVHRDLIASSFSLNFGAKAIYERHFATSDYLLLWINSLVRATNRDAVSFTGPFYPGSTGSFVHSHKWAFKLIDQTGKMDDLTSLSGRGDGVLIYRIRSTNPMRPALLDSAPVVHSENGNADLDGPTSAEIFRRLGELGEGMQMLGAMLAKLASRTLALDRNRGDDSGS